MSRARYSFASLWTTWRDKPPADQIARSTLKVEFGYAENAAALLLTLYKANLAFAKLAAPSDDSPVAVKGREPHEGSPAPAPPPIREVRIGDDVQWTSNGQDQFEKPRRVNWLSEDGRHARVFGSMTGIPTSELTVVDAPKLTPQGGPRSASSAYAGQDGDLSVLLRGNRLEISADVDRAGLQRLKEILGKYEEILQLIDPGSSGRE